MFARALQASQLVLRNARGQLRHSAPGYGDRARAYRSVLTCSAIVEGGLFGGKILGVRATNALKLGFDVCHLDTTVQARASWHHREPVAAGSPSPGRGRETPLFSHWRMTC